MPGLFDRLQSEIEGREKASGLSMADVLALPDDLRKLVNWMMKRKRDVTLSQVAEYSEQDEKATRHMLETLIEQGFVREIAVPDEETRYRVRLAWRKQQEIPLNLWDALQEKTE